jgi:hypothetical protein
VSYHLHLRAVPAADAGLGSTQLAALMEAAWTARAAEIDAGLAASVEKTFASVHHLYTGAPDGGGDTGEPSGLPVFGGRLVPQDDGPPFVVLDPAQVRSAAEFLTAASFHALWQARRTELALTGDPAIDRQIHQVDHQALTTFYRSAARAGDAVVKAFWF